MLARFAILACLIWCASANGADPIESDDDYIRVNIKGRLHKGMNGPTLTARGMTWRLSLETERLRQTAEQLYGLKVLVHGTLEEQKGDKGKELVVAALSIQRVVHRITMIGKADGTLKHVVWNDSLKITQLDTLKTIVKASRPTELVFEFDKAMDPERAGQIQMEIVSIRGLPLKRITFGPKPSSE